MIDPDWLFTDPVPQRTKGWQPRPRGGVMLRQAFAAPDEMGAGQDEPQAYRRNEWLDQPQPTDYAGSALSGAVQDAVAIPPGAFENEASIEPTPISPPGAKASAPKPAAESNMRGSASPPVTSTPAPDTWGTDLVPDQFGDRELSASEAQSACGPAAAVAFARRYGRNPTLREAVTIAEQRNLYAQSTGMYGPEAEVQLMRELGVQAHLANPEPTTIQRSVAGGNPVGIDTPNHYFVIDGYDAQRDLYHVGHSGTAFKVGAPWMSLDQIGKLGGGVRTAIYADNPLTDSSPFLPATSPLSPATDKTAPDRRRTPLTTSSASPEQAPPEQPTFQNRTAKSWFTYVDDGKEVMKIDWGDEEPEFQVLGDAQGDPGTVRQTGTLGAGQDEIDPGTGGSEDDQTVWPVLDDLNPPKKKPEDSQKFWPVPNEDRSGIPPTVDRPNESTDPSFRGTLSSAGPGLPGAPTPSDDLTRPPITEAPPDRPARTDVRDMNLPDQQTIWQLPESHPIQLAQPDRRKLQEVPNLRTGKSTLQPVGPDPNAGVTEIGKAAAGLPVNPLQWREDFQKAAVENVVPEQIQKAPVIGGLVEQTFDPLFGPAGGVGGKALEGATAVAGKAVPAVARAAGEQASEWFPTVAKPVQQALKVADTKLWDPFTHTYQAAWDSIMPDTLASGAPGRASTRAAIDLASGAVSAGVMAHQTDQSDPNYWQKIAAAGVGGIVAAHVAMSVAPDIVRGWNHYFEPTKNIADKNVRIAFAARANRINGARGEGALWRMRSTQDLGRAGRGLNNLTGMRLLEENGDFGPASNVAQSQFAQDWAQFARDTGDEGRKLGYIHGDVTTRGVPGTPAPTVYVPRVLEDHLNQAGKAPGVWAGKLNPKDSYSNFREHLFIRDAQANGVRLADNAGESFGHYAEHVMTSRANALFVKDLKKLSPGSVVRVRSTKNIPKGYTWGGQYLKQWQNVAFSNELDTALKNITSPGITDPIGRTALNLMGAAKNALFAPSLFHFVSEMRQVVSAGGAKGLPVLPRSMFYMLHPGAARKFWLEPGTMNEVRRAMNSGLIMFRGNPEISGPGYQGLAGKTAEAGWGAVASGAAGFTQARTDETLTDQQRLERGLQAAGIGAVGGFVGGNLSHALWTRAVPAMKFLTWQLLEKSSGAEEAARFVNSVYGGQNLEAIARSRKFQDILRLTVLAPDWQEGWIRQVGNFFKPGPAGTGIASGIRHSIPLPGIGAAPRNVPEMNRQYWLRAAAMEAFILEGLNLGINGHWSGDNGHGHELTLETTGLYDRMGWDHTDPQTGEKYRTYEDILGPYRSMMQAPLDPGRFAAARVGLVPSELQTLSTGKDWRGQDISSSTDDPLKSTAIRAAYMLSRLAPVGPAELVRTIGKEPPGVAAFQSVTGLRAQRMSPLQEKVQDRDKKFQQHGFTVERERDFNTQYGLEVAQAARDTGNVFSRAKDKTHAQIVTEVQRVDWPNRQKQLEALEPTDIAADPVKHADWVTFIRSIGSIGTQSSEASADLTESPDINIKAVQSMYWNPPGKTPEEMAQLTPKGRDTVREQTIVQQALEAGVDPNAMRDALKAQERGIDLPKLPGVSSAVLDDWTQQWRNTTDEDPQVQADKRRQLIDQFAREHGVDSASVYQRIKLRNTPLNNEDPKEPGISADEKSRREMQTSYERAQDVLYSSRDPQKYPKYANPDGSPYKGSSEQQWADFDRQIAADTKAGSSKHTPEIQTLLQARAAGDATRLKFLYKDPAGPDYQRWYGVGRNMTDAKWQEYVRGQGKQFTDVQDPTENRRRTRTLELWKASTPKERQTTMVKIKLNIDGQLRDETTTLEQAKKQIERVTDPRWKVDLGLDDTGSVSTQSGG